MLHVRPPNVGSGRRAVRLVKDAQVKEVAALSRRLLWDEGGRIRTRSFHRKQAPPASMMPGEPCQWLVA